MACSFFPCQTIYFTLVCSVCISTYKISFLDPSIKMQQAKQLGKGSVCSVLMKNPHLKSILTVAFLNITVKDCIHDLTAFKKASVQCWGGHVTKNAIYFLMHLIQYAEAWAAVGFAHVLQECPE